jgi:hypothetical protein
MHTATVPPNGHTASTATDRQRAKISEWLSRLLLPDQIVEVRCLRGFASRTFALSESGAIDRLAEFAASYSGKSQGVYYTPNPLKTAIPAGSQGTALDADVARRRWLLVDVDPKRAKGTNATAAEHDSAVARARTIRDTLALRGFGGMVLIGSGNGGQVMIPVDLPNDELTRDRHKALLRCLEERFGTPVVEVDRSTFNAARIWKLPATLAAKGPSTPERRRRYARIIDLPDGDLHRFDEANAAAFAKLLMDWGGRYKADCDWVRFKVAGTDDRSVLIRRAMAYLEKEPPAVSGQHGHDRCFHVACVLVVKFGLTKEEAFAAIQPWKGRCQPPWSEKDLRHKIDDADKQPGPRGEYANARNGAANGHTKSPTPQGPPLDLPNELVLRASKIVPRKVEWLWPGRVPMSKLTTFAGVTSVGKTFALLDITARVSRGSEWPDTGGECAQVGQTLFVTAEDDPDDTLVPRLIEMGADLDNIAFLKSEVADRFTLTDLTTLGKALEQSGPDVRLIAIDPPTAFLGGANDHKNAELRGLLSPLKTFAQKHHVAIIFITHFNKPTAAKTDALMRVMGSVARGTGQGGVDRRGGHDRRRRGSR